MVGIRPRHPAPLTPPPQSSLVLAVGALLTFDATRATANVQNGRTFLRWMPVVFAASVVLMSLPILAAKA